MTAPEELAHLLNVGLCLAICIIKILGLSGSATLVVQNYLQVANMYNHTIIRTLVLDALMKDL